jgi:hypothetical protein
MSYPISTPVTFEPSSTNDEIDFKASTAGVDNKLLNFGVTTAGDILYRESGGSNYLTRLPIGAEGDVLQTVGGLPVWSNSMVAQGQGVFTAHVTGSLGGIPTSRTGAAGGTGTWYALSGVVAGPAPYVTWSTASPGADPDSAFTTAAGVDYGRFTVPASVDNPVYYTMSAQITFDSGEGVGAGTGISGSAPDGRACRQIRIYNVTTATAIATAVTQNSPNNDNQTVCRCVAENVSLSPGDKLEIQVRHDRSATSTASIGATGVAFQTYFTGKRVR